MEDSIGPFENVLVALTFLGVLYLVMKQADIKLSVSKGEGLTATALGFNTVSDAANVAFYSPEGRGLEGFSDGAMEAPVFHATPFNEADFNPVAFEQDAANIDYGNLGNKVWKHQPKYFMSKASATNTKFDEEVVPQNRAPNTKGYVEYDEYTREGARGYAAHRRSGMMDAKLLSVLGGNSVSL